MKKQLAYVIFLLIGLSSCRPEEIMPEASDDSPYILNIPSHFPDPEIPADNALTEKRVALGKALFYDSRLSRDNSISCGSCHFQEYAFTDQLPKSIGIEGRTGIRNAPSLANVAYRNRLMMDGGVPTLELQVMAPLHDPNEFDFDILEAAHRLNQDESLRNLSLEAYDREIDPYVITRAIASFERTFISGNSAWDKHLNGDENALSEEAKRGEALFFSERTSCGSCHQGFNLSDENYHNIGLYSLYNDEGRARITMANSDKGKFKTPSLRNIALTSPYMHDGSIETLQDVLMFFNGGGEHHEIKDKRIRQLNLNEEEIEDLLAFLTALTDTEFISNPEYYPQ